MNKRAEVEKMAEEIRPQLKIIDPDLTVNAEQRRVDPLKGEDYLDWVLLFKCGDIKFSMDPTDNIDAIGRVFIKQSLRTKQTLSIKEYNNSQTKTDRAICEMLNNIIDHELREAESKIWHAHPVWFLDGNPVVGYHKLKDSVRLLFWSGQSFDEAGLKDEGSFKAAEIRFTDKDQINEVDLKRWLKKAREIQWDYKNIVKRKGQLIRLK